EFQTASARGFQTRILRHRRAHGTVSDCSPVNDGPAYPAQPSQAQSSTQRWSAETTVRAQWSRRSVVVSTWQTSGCLTGPTREPRRDPRAEATSRPSAQHHGGALQAAPAVGEEPRDDLAVDDTMIGTDRQRGDLSRHDLIVDDPRLLPHLSEGEDRCLTRVDDRSAGIDAEHADLRDGDGS